MYTALKCPAAELEWPGATSIYRRGAITGCCGQIKLTPRRFTMLINTPPWSEIITRGMRGGCISLMGRGGGEFRERGKPSARVRVQYRIYFDFEKVSFDWWYWLYVSLYNFNPAENLSLINRWVNNMTCHRKILVRRRGIRLRAVISYRLHYEKQSTTFITIKVVPTC